MFESIIENAEPIKLTSETITNPFSVLEMTGASFIDYLKVKHGDEELRKYFVEYYSLILKEIFENHNTQLKELLQNSDNIPQFAVAMQSVTNFTLLDKEYCNVLVYDYFKQKVQERNADLKASYLNLAKAVNREVVSKLSIYIPTDLGALLAMARFSTRDTNRATKRVNSILVQQDVSFLTEQKIVDIYLSLYERVTPLFIGIMSDYRNPKQMGSSASEIWSTINLAILDILENMPTEEIAKVMKSFIDTIRMGYLKQPKFSMETVNTMDYPRTISVYMNIVSQKTLDL